MKDEVLVSYLLGLLHSDGTYSNEWRFCSTDRQHATDVFRRFEDVAKFGEYEYQYPSTGRYSYFLVRFSSSFSDLIDGRGLQRDKDKLRWGD